MANSMRGTNLQLFGNSCMQYLGNVTIRKEGLNHSYKKSTTGKLHQQ